MTNRSLDAGEASGRHATPDHHGRSPPARARERRAFEAWLFGAGALIAATWTMWQWWHGSASVATQVLSMAVVFVAGFVGGVAGFAFSAIAAPGFAHLHVSPVEAVETMAFCSIAIQTYGVIAIWKAIRWVRVLPFLVGGLATLPFAVHVLSQISASHFNVLLGLFLVVYALQALTRRQVRNWSRNRWTDLAAGALGGITGGLAAFPGAFVTVWCTLCGLTKEESRGIYQPYILVMQIAAIAWMRVEAIPFVPAASAACSAAFALLAAHLGLVVFRRLTNPQFARLVYTLLAVSGVALLSRGF